MLSVLEENTGSEKRSDCCSRSHFSTFLPVFCGGSLYIYIWALVYQGVYQAFFRVQISKFLLFWLLLPISQSAFWPFFELRLLSVAWGWGLLCPSTGSLAAIFTVWSSEWDWWDIGKQSCLHNYLGGWLYTRSFALVSSDTPPVFNVGMMRYCLYQHFLMHWGSPSSWVI